jgi:hypothetical protein
MRIGIRDTGLGINIPDPQHWFEDSVFDYAVKVIINWDFRVSYSS